MGSTGDMHLQKKSCIVPQEVIVMKTTVTSRGQAVVPAKIRKDHQIGSRTQLEWIDDGETIRVVPLPAEADRAWAAVRFSDGTEVMVSAEELYTRKS